MSILWIFNIILFFSVSFAESTYVLCRNQKMVRTIRIESNVDGVTCMTKYTKAGVDQVVAASRSQNSCKTVLENIKTNLEKAAWNCKDISSSRISTEGVSVQ